MKINSVVVTIIGILLVLNLMGLDQIGTPLSGISGWLIALAVLVIGVKDLLKAYK